MLEIALMVVKKKLKKTLNWHSLNKKLQKSGRVCLVIAYQSIKVSDKNYANFVDGAANMWTRKTEYLLRDI